jgi:glycosyltransferase involved in cell wall biosynthesis
MGRLKDMPIYLLASVKRAHLIGHVRTGNWTQMGVIEFFDRINSKSTYIFHTPSLMDTTNVINGSKKLVWNFIDPVYDESVEFDEMPLTRSLVYLSTLFESKGIIDLCDWFEKYAPKDLTLEIYGYADVKMLGKVGGYSKKDSRINYHGVLTTCLEIRNVLQKAAYFVLPTRYKNEAAPRSLIEALSQGCAIITTNHAGIPDLLEGCPHALILESTMFEEGDKVLQFIESKAINSKVRYDIRRFYDIKFSFMKVQQTLLNIFN